VAVPRTFSPALKVTIPVGVTVDDVIEAVNVTAWPAEEGFADDVIVAALIA